MIRHDLACPGCDYEARDQLVRFAEYGDCPRCGTALRWVPTTPPATDVCGSVQTSNVLTDAAGNDLTWSSSRERDAKMLRDFGVRPVGDTVRGARTPYDPLGKHSFHFGSGTGRNRKSSREKRA
jgi:hypothetical protein